MNRTIPDYQQLSIAERLQLVADIWDSIVADSPGAIDLSPAQREAVRSRIAAHQADPASAVEWDAVRAEMFQRNH